MNDDQLRRLLSDAVSDIEPEDRIERAARLGAPEPRRWCRCRRPRSWYAGAADRRDRGRDRRDRLRDLGGGRQVDDARAGDGSGTAPVADQAIADRHRPPRRPSTAAPPSRGRSPWRSTTSGTARAGRALPEATPSRSDVPPLDAAVVEPDDRSRRPRLPDRLAARLARSPPSSRHGVIEVDLGNAPVDATGLDVARATAYEAVQSAVYTLQAAPDAPRPGQFTRGGPAGGRGCSASRPSSPVERRAGSPTCCRG